MELHGAEAGSEFYLVVMTIFLITWRVKLRPCLQNRLANLCSQFAERDDGKIDGT